MYYPILTRLFKAFTSFHLASRAVAIPNGTEFSSLLEPRQVGLCVESNTFQANVAFTLTATDPNGNQLKAALGFGADPVLEVPGAPMFLSNYGQSIFFLLNGDVLYSYSVNNHFCGFDFDGVRYFVICGLDQSQQRPVAKVEGLTWTIVTTCPSGSLGAPVYELQVAFPDGSANPNPGSFQVFLPFQEGQFLVYCNDYNDCTSDFWANVTLTATVLALTPLCMP